MKKNLFLIVLFLLATFGVTKAYFHSGFPYTHDGENHLARFANYALAVRELQLPPRFAPNLFSHFGYPVFDFNYPLGNILSLPFTFAHLNYELTFKLMVIVAVFFGLCGVFCWLRKFGFARLTAVLAAILFAFNPYLLNAILYRGNIGEILALCIFPWLFWAVEVAHSNLVLEKKKIHVVFVLALFVGFFLAHNIAAVFGMPFVLLYAALRLRKDRQKWVWFGGLLLVSFFLTLWFWLPALLEKSVTVLDQVALNTEFFDHFPTLAQLLISPLQFGFSYKGNIDSLSFSLGATQLIAFLLATVFLLKQLFCSLVKRNSLYSEEKKSVTSETTNKEVTISVLLIVCWLLFIFQLQFTQPIWSILFPIAKYIQFPWRLSMFWEVLMLPVFAFLFESFAQKTQSTNFSKQHNFSRWQVLLVLILLLQIDGFLRLKPVDYFHHDKQDYEYFTQSTSTLNEDRVRAFTFENFGDWQPGPRVLSGAAEFQVAKWRGSNRTYTAAVTQPAIIVEETMNFPGWQTVVNGKKVSYIDSTVIGGRIAYTLPVGTFSVHSQFTENTPSRIIGDGASIVTFVGIGIWLWRKRT